MAADSTVQERLVAAFGLPDLVFDVPADPRPDAPMNHLHIAGFLPGGPAGPYVFCTEGASHAPMADGRRVEGMLAFQPAPSEQLKDPILRLLTAFALHVHGSDKPVQFGEVIRAEQDMSELSPMRGLMFAPPVIFDEAAHQLGSEEAPVELMWLVPIYDEEAQLLLARGPTELLSRFIEEETNLLNFSRGPVRLKPRPPAQERKPPQRKPRKIQRARPSARGPMIGRPTPGAGVKRGYAGGAPPPKPPAGEAKRAPGIAVPPTPKMRPRPKLSSKPRPASTPRSAPPPKKAEIRFDLDKGKEPVERKAPRLPPPRHLGKRPTEEDKAAARAARIAELKQKAKDANRRAKERAKRDAGKQD